MRHHHFIVAGYNGKIRRYKKIVMFFVDSHHEEWLIVIEMGVPELTKARRGKYYRTIEEFELLGLDVFQVRVYT